MEPIKLILEIIASVPNINVIDKSTKIDSNLTLREAHVKFLLAQKTMKGSIALFEILLYTKLKESSNS